MKTQPMSHQIEGLRRLAGRKFFALNPDQGTGKTWIALADAERLFKAGEISAVLVFAPKGVHTNWVLREIPKHLEVRCVARAWESGAGVKATAALEEIFKPRPPSEAEVLRVLTMNYDAIITDRGREFANRFMNTFKVMIILDEAHRIKTPDSERTKQIMRLRPRAAYVRTLTGTAISKGPPDLFSQYEFLERGLLGTTSYRAFVAEYAELLQPDHPQMRAIARRTPNGHMAQVVARDILGRPKWKNIERLKKLIEPHHFRVLKSDCLDLPPKIYRTMTFDLTPPVRRAYNRLRDDLQIELVEGETLTVDKLAAIIKLQQITSGFVIIEGTPQLLPVKDNPRLKTLMDAIEDIDGQFIIWSRFTEEIRQITEALKAAGISAAQFTGSTPQKMRDQIVDEFQAGRIAAFVGQPQAGGVGLTLTAAETVIYYSNDYNMVTRNQSEDRAHRIGTHKPVTYIDLAAADTIDESIARNLQNKHEVSALIMSDARPGSTPGAPSARIGAGPRGGS